MFKLIEAQTANGVWKQAAAVFQQSMAAMHANPLAGGSREIHHVALSVENPRQRWVFAREPAINPAFALAEVVWIVRGRHDAAFVTHWNKALPRFAGTTQQFHGAYGFRLRHHFGIDQLERVAAVLSAAPVSRQASLQIWDAAIDLPCVDGTPAAPDIPCNVHSCLKIVDRRLEWLQIVRSNDLFLGVPYNLIQWTTIQELLAGWLGIEVGSYNQVSDSLHIYDRDAERLNQISVADAENIDSIALPREESEACFCRLETSLEHLMNDGASAIPILLRQTNFPPGFRNWLVLFCAEQYRHSNDGSSSLSVIGECTNPAIALAWSRWRERCQTAAGAETRT